MKREYGCLSVTQYKERRQTPTGFFTATHTAPCSTTPGSHKRNSRSNSQPPHTGHNHFDRFFRTTASLETILQSAQLQEKRAKWLIDQNSNTIIHERHHRKNSRSVQLHDIRIAFKPHTSILSRMRSAKDEVHV